MEQEQVIRNLRKQLLIERIIFAVIALILATSWVSARIGSKESLIVVDGKPIVCVQTAKDAEVILEQIKSKAGSNTSEIQFKQEVRVARAPRGMTPVSRHKAIRIVQRFVSPVVSRWAIIADGKPVVAVPSREIAGEALDLAKLKFGKMVENLAEEPQFKENVTVDIAAVSPSMYRKTATEAVDFIFTETTPVSKDGVYTVRQGDMAVSIANRNGINLDDLKKMNPGINLGRLQIDDKIRIKTTAPSKPKLTVVVRDQEQRIERIPAPVQSVSSASIYSGKTVELSSGRSGQRKVKAAVIYENGRRTDSEILEEEILRTPSPRRIAVGIKPRPTW